MSQRHETAPRLRDTLREESGSLLAIAGVWALALAIVGLGPDVPLQDDWTYAWSVEHLLETGRFDVLQWSLHFPLFQVYWAGGFAKLFGFSFGVLRASSLTLAMTATFVLHLLLRELGVDRRASLLAALTFALNPIVFVLAFTFMTDVPLYALTLASAYAFVGGHTRSRPSWSWAGAGIAVAAFLARQIGIVTPVVALPMVVAAWPDWRSMLRRAAPLAVAWAAMGAASVALTTFVGPTSYMLTKLQSLEGLLLVPIGQYLNYNLFSLLQASFALLPMLSALVAARAVSWRVVAVFALVCAGGLVARFGHLPVALSPGESWSLVELGSSLELLPGGQPRDPAGALDVTLQVLGPLAMGALFAVAWSCVRARRPLPAVVWGVALLAFVHVLELNALWLYVDRYVMMTLPLVLALVAWATSGVRLARSAGVAVLALWFAVDVVGTRFAMRVNAEAMTLWHEVQASGVPAWEIDAGYTINGWMLYAHPERLAPGMDPDRDVPFVTASRTAEWLIGHAPVEGYDVVRVVTWADLPWPSRHRLYVLRRAGRGQVLP
ncbi:MAG: glycosyltransferase family 39 protein [Vicinamibacterales bacterium]